MSSDKEKNEKNEAIAAKVAGAAVAIGIAWGIFKFVRAKKEEDALIQEYYGDRDEFVVPPDEDGYDGEEVYIEERTEFIKTEPPPPPPPEVTPPHSDVLKEEVREFEKLEPPPPEPKREEKPWFLCLFDPPKKSNGQAKAKEREFFDSGDRDLKENHTYEIKWGDTLWAISAKHGISLGALKAANGLRGDCIYAGDKIVIPPK